MKYRLKDNSRHTILAVISTLWALLFQNYLFPILKTKYFIIIPDKLASSENHILADLDIHCVSYSLF